METDNEKLKAIIKKMAQEWERERHAILNELAEAKKENELLKEQSCNVNKYNYEHFFTKMEDFELLQKNEIEKEIRTLRDEIRRQMTYISYDNTELKSQKGKIADLEESVTEFLKELEILNKDYNKLLILKDNYNEKLQANKKVIYDMAARKASLENTYSELQQERNELINSITSAKIETRKQLMTIASTNEKISKAKEDIDNIENNITDIVDIKILESDNDRIEKQKIANEEKVQQVKRELEQIEKRRQELQQKMNLLSEERNGHSKPADTIKNDDKEQQAKGLKSIRNTIISRMNMRNMYEK